MTGRSFYDETNTLFYRIENKKEDYKSIGMCQFNAPDGSLLALKDDYTTSSMSGVSILIEDAWDASAIVVATVMALNPGLGYNEAFDLAEDIVENVGNMDGLSSNSLKYVFSVKTKAIPAITICSYPLSKRLARRVLWSA